jgi:hypothetical protein
MLHHTVRKPFQGADSGGFCLGKSSRLHGNWLPSPGRGPGSDTQHLELRAPDKSNHCTSLCSVPSLGEPSRASQLSPL